MTNSSDVAAGDGRSTIELELENETLFDLFMAAHNQDITLNQLIENILKRAMDEDALKELTAGE
jgi:hypothetical protein